MKGSDLIKLILDSGATDLPVVVPDKRNVWKRVNKKYFKKGTNIFIIGETK